MGFVLICFPFLMAALAFATPSELWRVRLLPFTGAVHLALTLVTLANPGLATGYGWLQLDPAGRIVQLLVSLIFCACGFYTHGYLRYRADRPNRIFCICLLVLPGIMSLVAWSHHMGLMWIAVEATSLAGAPLIYFNRTPRSIEATWKYLLVGSVGIAMALLGTFFLAYATVHHGFAVSMQFDDLLAASPNASKPWLHAAFILLLVGYGTKMGLAPMHTWKPDAYGEAPGVVGAMMAGGLTSCGFLAILRVFHLCNAAGEGLFMNRILIFMGLFSMAVAAVFIVGQRDFKRMLAYSSVEHMGILILGLGIGGNAIYGVLLHLVNNALTKGVMFLSAGNIHRSFNSKNTAEVTGALNRLPFSGTLFLCGFLAVTGSPPFGPFLSEFTILNAGFGSGRYLEASLFLFFLLIVFIGMGSAVLTVVQGRPSAGTPDTPYRDSLRTCLPIAILMGLVLMLGLYIPSFLNNLLREGASFLGARS